MAMLTDQVEGCLGLNTSVEIEAISENIGNSSSEDSRSLILITEDEGVNGSKNSNKSMRPIGRATLSLPARVSVAKKSGIPRIFKNFLK